MHKETRVFLVPLREEKHLLLLCFFSFSYYYHSNLYIFLVGHHQLGATTPIDSFSCNHYLIILYSHNFDGHHMLESTYPIKPYPTTTRLSSHHWMEMLLPIYYFSNHHPYLVQPLPPQTLGATLSFILKLNSMENYITQKQHISPL